MADDDREPGRVRPDGAPEDRVMEPWALTLFLGVLGVVVVAALVLLVFGVRFFGGS